MAFGRRGCKHRLLRYGTKNLYGKHSRIESYAKSMNAPCVVEPTEKCTVLRLSSQDGTNRLTLECVCALTECVHQLAAATPPKPLVITGNDEFFSAGADLREISQLHGPNALEFSKLGQALMRAVNEFPNAAYAAISGYCMGGGLDLALACHRRIAHPHAIFGHRGAALGLITGWGGTQRLPRLIGKGRALQMFVAAEKIHAAQALQMGLVDAVADDPVAEAVRRLRNCAGHAF
jgi:enoyl-CoA hydratase/carnithine racemase